MDLMKVRQLSEQQPEQAMKLFLPHVGRVSDAVRLAARVKPLVLVPAVPEN